MKRLLITSTVFLFLNLSISVAQNSHIFKGTTSDDIVNTDPEKENDSVCVETFKHTISGDSEKTMSPYFYVKSNHPLKDNLPLKKTDVDIQIAGIIADVCVKQIYVNESENVLEAIYIFPGSTRSAVYGMTMFIGDRKLKAEIKEKEQAREDYEKAKQEGKTASLLEQHRPNVFQMNVANILPGDSITVVLNYTEHIESVKGVYEFVFPTVVGPRYSENSPEWNSILKKQNEDKPDFEVDIKTTLNSAVPLEFVKSKSHAINTTFPEINKAIVTLSDKDAAFDKMSPETSSEGIWIGRDYILNFSLRGENPSSGLLTYEHEDENFFMLMIQPPEKVSVNEIPKREYIFIIDISGSMGGFPISVSKKLMKNLLSNLNSSDKFNVMLFAGSNKMIFRESVFATNKNISIALGEIDSRGAGGSTQIYPAVLRALKMDPGDGYSRIFVPITDGYVSIEKQLFQLVKDNLGEANMFAFGIGSSVNRYLIKGLAHAGNGEPFVVTNHQEAEEQGKNLFNLIRNPVLTNIEVNYEDFEVYDVNLSQIPDVFAERPTIIYGKYKGKASGSILIKGIRGGTEYSEKINIKHSLTKSNKALRYLWARNKINYWDDFAQYYEDFNKQKEEITKLALEYNLLSQYTSFVAIDNIIRNNTESIDTNKQKNLNNFNNKSIPANKNYYNSLSNISLGNSTNVEEVVVTGLGINRNSKSLGYSMKDVSKEDLNKTTLQSLQGKVAGVSITNASGSPGSSNQIIMRGHSSVSGGCQPLFIIDGIPVNNTISGNTVINDGTDFGNNINQINPNDIKTISVLKGENATALYGSRASNGAIIITTKKGSPGKKLNIFFESSFSSDKIDKLPELQTKFSQSGAIESILNYEDERFNESFSWGPKIEDIVNLRSYNKKEFFITGNTLSNVISIDGNINKNHKYYLSGTNVLQNSFIPNSKLKSNSLKLRLDNNVGKLKNKTIFLYNDSKSHNLSLNHSYSDVLYDLLTSSPSFDNANGYNPEEALNNEESYLYPDGSQRSYNGGISDNPYFDVNRNIRSGHTNRFSVSLSPVYHILENLTLALIESFNRSTESNTVGFDINSSYKPLGEYTEFTSLLTDNFANLSIEYQTNNFDNIDIVLLCGISYDYSEMETDEESIESLSIPGIFNFEGQHSNTVSNTVNKSLAGAFTEIGISFKNYLFMNISAKGEQSSILPIKRNKLLSASTGISFVFSDIIYGLNNIIPYGKFRISFGTKQNEVPYIIDKTFFTEDMFNINNSLYGYRKVTYNENICPERASTFEMGTDIRFYNNRIKFDFSWFNSVITNKFIPQSITENNVHIISKGTQNNSGFEIILNTAIIKSSDIDFSTDLIFSKSENIITGISDEASDGYVLLGLSGFSSRIIEGQTYGVFYGSKYLRNNDGIMIIGSDGFPMIDPQQGIIGDPTPKFTAGINSKLTMFKQFELTANFDIKKGGDVWNGTKNSLNYFGVSKESGDIREETGYIFEGITENGDINTTQINFSSYTNGTKDNYFVKYGPYGVAEDAVEDGSWFRLNHLQFRYYFRKRILNKFSCNQLSISLFAKNVFMITNYSGVTPDTDIVNNLHGIGIDYFNLPASKSYGFMVRIRF